MISLLLGSRVFWFAALAIAAVAAFYAYTVHQQNLGAYQFQAKQQQAQLAAEREHADKQASAMAKRLSVAQAASAAALAQVAKYQEALKHDQETIDWMGRCGALPVPCGVRSYALGRMPADCAAAPGSNH